MLAALPCLVVKKRPACMNFSAGKKLFAFTTKRGAVILKPAGETTKILVENNTASRAVMGNGS
jgi:hypothetical protein